MASHRFWYAGCVLSSAVAALTVAGTVWSARVPIAALHATEQPAQTPVAALASVFTLDGPFTHANLTVYVVRGSTTDAREYITLDEGLAARTVAVREKTRAGQDRAEVNLDGHDRATYTEEGVDDALLDAIRRLPRRQREVVVLRIWLDLDTRTAAEVLGISANTVAVHLSRATATLRAQFAPVAS